MRARRLHRQRPATLARQKGQALILLVTVLVIGVVWYTVGALGTAAPTNAERDTRTGLALEAAKKALLGYVALKAADPSENTPGRLPCPESLGQPSPPGQPPTSAEGQAAPVVNPPFPTCSPIGRLPWETLGIDQIRDGYGEPLWYAVATGTWALVNSSTNLTINPGFPGNQLTFDGTANAVVAVIIAPGPPLNTMSEPGTPPAGCAKVNQQSNRYAVPYVPSNFVECGNASGSYTTVGISLWSNDRTISITAAEVMNAIAGAVADRLQRQVAPVLETWDQTEQSVRGKSWGSTYSKPYMPFASTFSNPSTNGYCGNAAVQMREGLPPTAGASSGTCTTAWSGSASALLGLINLGCTNSGTELVCSLLGLFAPFSVTITAQAPNVANSFRGTITQSDVWATGGGSVNSFALTSFSSTTGTAQISTTVTWPLVGLFSTVQVHIPNLPDAVFMSVPTQPSYTATKWFRDNNWQQYTYYAVGSGVTLNPATVCTAPGDAGCLTLNSLPASTGSPSDKKLVLAYMGPQPTGTQLWPSLETATHSTSSPTIYTASTVTSIMNDRLAACPFRQTPDPVSGSAITICN